MRDFTNRLTVFAVRGALVLGMALLPAAVRAETLTDNFEATEAPTAGNDYNLNAQLDARQAGTLAPAEYTRIAGDANLIQVNSSTPDAQGAESGLGKLDFLNSGVNFTAVQLADIVPPGNSIELSLEITPIANNPARDSDDWFCIDVGATGGNGFVNNPLGGVGVLIRDNGGYQVFNNGPLIADGGVAAAGTYTIEILLNAEKNRYSLSINGEKVLDQVAVTVTGSLIQLGGYGGPPAGQPFAMHLADNLSVITESAPVVACFTAEPGHGASPLSVDVDASCSVVQGTAESYQWDFGDGSTASGVTASHVYAAAGDYTITLTVTDTAANGASAEQPVRVFDSVLSYTNDFEVPDGPPGGWTVAAGEWRIEGGALAAGPTTAEQFIFAGDPAVSLPRYVTFSWDYRFLAGGDVPDIGRHGGMLFGASLPVAREDPAFTGYFVDWIDRASDRGVRLSRADHGVFVTLVGGAPDSPAEPPVIWRVEIEDDHIRVFGDGVLYIDHIDGTYRSGLFGFWTWQGGQEVRIDDVSVASRPVTACASASPALAIFPASTIQLSAACSEATQGSLVSYDWDFGDGTVASGLEVEHTYDAPGLYTVSLAVSTDGGLSDDATREVEILENLQPFADCFDRPAGPVDTWTADSGEWRITDTGELSKSVSSAENFAWAGAPPLPTEGDFALELDFTFGATATPPVGRHGGIMFYASRPTQRYDPAISGYTLDWIERDHQYRLLRVDNAAQVQLATVVPDPPEPATRWGVAVEGDHIRVLAGGEQIMDVEDSTYRAGYFGLWAYSNNESLLIDNVALPPTAPPPCRVDLACSLTEDDPPLLHVEAAPFAEGCAPSGCGGCPEVEISIDGVVAGVFAVEAGAVSQDLPLPDPCEALSEHTVTARCLDGEGTGAEASCAFTCPEPPGGLQKPLDTNQDGNLDISDPVGLLNFLFLGTLPRLPCGDGTAADPANIALLDSNADGKIDLSDAVHSLAFLFLGGGPPLPCAGDVGCPCLRIAGCADGVCVP